MSETEKVIENLNTAKLILCNPQILTPEIRIRIGQAVTDAITLLKEHEAVKPVRDKKTGRVWLCGNCGSYVGFEDHDENDPNEFDKYCRECGRPVLWEGR